MKRPGLSTLSVHAGAPPATPGAPLVTPLVSSSTFRNLPEPEGEVLYGRYANTENHRLVGEKLAALDGAEAALVVGSGMAAISMTILSFVGAGDHIVAAESLYGGTLTLLTRELPRLGIETTFVDPAGGWRDALRPNTRLLYLEVPVNPTLRVPDPRPVARLARERSLPLAVDATFATPINWRPIEDGADVVIHSGTKYLGGHSDLVAGVIAGPAAVVEQARERLKAFGPSLDPHAIWLLERGLKTLAIRVERQNATALALARWLAGHPAVAAVHHPGLESHPDHGVAAAIFSGFGGMLSLVVRGGDDAARRVMERFELIAVAPSLGGVESLASMPRYTSHAALTREQRLAMGIEDGFIRLSIGIEDMPDLQADLERALAADAP
ncbi:MAG TPA: aminotransferase class I/II-fold pyridoxal phosphate-dependent enzyme [Longimicrobiales bacterium]|nr:aminotransferase class I/II-fold pyridoxal phosphate-dependent enzyme [Longimicrobiales bacterium]